MRVAATLPDTAVITVFDGNGAAPREAWTGAEIAEDGADGAWLPAHNGECLVVQITLAHAQEAHAASVWLRNVAHRFTGEELETARAATRRTKRTQAPENGETAVPWHAGRHRTRCAARYVSVCERLEPLEEVAAHASAVGHYHYEAESGTFLCTGTLLNDGRDDGAPRDPLFLTAAHCVGTNTEARSMDLAFDWIDRSCSPEPTKRLARPAKLLASAPEFDQTLVRLGAWPAPHSLVGRFALGWDTKKVTRQTPTRTLSHPGGHLMAYTAATVIGVRRRPVPVSGYGLVHNVISVHERDGITEPGSSGSALVKEGDSGQVIGALSHGPSEIESLGVCLGFLPASAGYGGFRDFYPRIAQFLSNGTGTVEPLDHTYRIPFVLRARARHNAFVRISSLSDTPGEVEITAIDDQGARCGPTSLRVGAAASIHFTSSHLEQGGRGLPGCGAPSRGHWRLELKANVALRAHGYVRTHDGFVTSVTQPVENLGDATSMDVVHAVPFVNPASNRSQRSFLRITNHGAQSTKVTLRLWDDKGTGPREASYHIKAGHTRQISAVEIEAQAGDGTGKWKALANATPAVALTVLSILNTPTGHMTNLSR